MADPRVINLPDNPAGPDSSGVGGMLFDRMQSQFKDAEAAKQLDVTEGIRSKYKAQADAQANQYNQGIEQLRSILTQGRTDELWAHQQRLNQQEAGGMERLIGQMQQSGVPMPGLTTPGETVGGATAPDTVNPVPAQAIDMARKVFTNALTEHSNKAEQRDRLSRETERAQIQQAMDITTDADERQGDLLAGQLALAGDTRTAAMITGLSRAGMGSKTTLQKFMQTGAEKLMVAQQNNETKLQITKEISLRHTELQKMKNQAKALTAVAKVDNTGYRNMDVLHKAMATGVARLETLQRDMGTQLLSEMPNSAQARKIQADMHVNNQAIHDGLAEMAGIRAKMAEFQNRSVSGEVQTDLPPAKPKRFGENLFGPKPIQ